MPDNGWRDELQKPCNFKIYIVQESDPRVVRLQEGLSRKTFGKGGIWTWHQRSGGIWIFGDVNDKRGSTFRILATKMA